MEMDDSVELVDHQMRKMIENLDLKIPSFRFSLTNGIEIEKLSKELVNSTNPGSCEIPVKILKSGSKKLFSAIAYLFNCCIIGNSIPDEWKKAVVTPLFKNKGSNDDMNNYRAISILPPISKLFEKLISKQIKHHFETNKLFSDSQHGFRSYHSCDTALHEIISQMNNIKSKRLIGLFLFIDFKKAFDSVDSKLLLLKLKHYGFNESAIKIIENYFINRSQVVKIEENISKECIIQLGVPQGSVLGPLLFLIFINDIVFNLNEFIVKLFADDTTLISIDNKLNDLLFNFHISIKKLTNWCNYNRIDINWSKTKVMFVTNKRNVFLPKTIIVENDQIEVVDNFKLLGVSIDNKLNFSKYVGDLKIAINKRLYSIYRLFYLSFEVKLQFLKTFILPYFDYCLIKYTIQKLSNYYNYCIYKLLKINNNVKMANDFNILNNNLNELNLNCFQHRIVKKLALFIHKMRNNNLAPSGLKDCFVFNHEKQNNYKLRNGNEMSLPSKGTFNDKMEDTYTYFFAKFINGILKNDINLNFRLFEQRITNNINLIFNKFYILFPRFDLQYKYC